MIPDRPRPHHPGHQQSCFDRERSGRWSSRPVWTLQPALVPVTLMATSSIVDVDVDGWLQRRFSLPVEGMVARLKRNP